MSDKRTPPTQPSFVKDEFRHAPVSSVRIPVPPPNNPKPTNTQQAPQPQKEK